MCTVKGSNHTHTKVEREGERETERVFTLQKKGVKLMFFKDKIFQYTSHVPPNRKHPFNVTHMLRSKQPLSLSLLSPSPFSASFFLSYLLIRPPGKD